MEIEPLIQIQKDLTPPDGRDFWTGPQEAGEPPFFTTREVALIFYAKKKLWLEKRLLAGKNNLDGKLIEIPRSHGHYPYRQFQLYHVELLTHAFFSQGIINFSIFTNAIVIVRAMARNYRLI